MELVITLIIVAAVLGIAWYAITQIPLPEPFRVVAVVVLCIFAILFLLELAPGIGGGIHLFHTGCP